MLFRSKVGLSVGDYYELNTGTAARPVFTDNAFGYFSAAGLLTVPIPANAMFGAWNFHAGVEFQKLGETTKAFNNGKGEKAIATVGIGLSY